MTKAIEPGAMMRRPPGAVKLARDLRRQLARELDVHD
jgi:hypothetical protein